MLVGLPENLRPMGARLRQNAEKSVETRGSRVGKRPVQRIGVCFKSPLGHFDQAVTWPISARSFASLDLGADMGAAPKIRGAQAPRRPRADDMGIVLLPYPPAASTAASCSICLRARSVNVHTDAK